MRLIQISDCHLLPDPKDRLKDWSTHGSLRKLLERVKTSEKKAHGIIFTGDISQQGDAQSYKNLNQLLSFTQKPVFALPGNHDDPLEMREQMRKRVQCVHSVDLGEWQMLLLDSRIEGEEAGYISEADLNWLAFWLKASTDKHTVVAVHHQPVPVGSAWIDELMLKNGDDLLNLLKDYSNVKAVIFGHVHQEYDSNVEHIRILGCPSSCFQFKAKADEFALDTELQPGYRWLELSKDGSLDTGVIRLKK